MSSFPVNSVFSIWRLRLSVPRKQKPLPSGRWVVAERDLVEHTEFCEHSFAFDVQCKGSNKSAADVLAELKQLRRILSP